MALTGFNSASDPWRTGLDHGMSHAIAAKAGRAISGAVITAQHRPKRGRHAPGRHSIYEPDAFGEMPVLCWCEAKVVHATPAEIRAGRTRSCGRITCKEAA